MAPPKQNASTLSMLQPAFIVGKNPHGVIGGPVPGTKMTALSVPTSIHTIHQGRIDAPVGFLKFAQFFAPSSSSKTALQQRVIDPVPDVELMPLVGRQQTMPYLKFVASLPGTKMIGHRSIPTAPRAQAVATIQAMAPVISPTAPEFVPKVQRGGVQEGNMEFFKKLRDGSATSYETENWRKTVTEMAGGCSGIGFGEQYDEPTSGTSLASLPDDNSTYNDASQHHVARRGPVPSHPSSSSLPSGQFKVIPRHAGQHQGISRGPMLTPPSSAPLSPGPFQYFQGHGANNSLSGTPPTPDSIHYPLTAEQQFLLAMIHEVPAPRPGGFRPMEMVLHASGLALQPRQPLPGTNSLGSRNNPRHVYRLADHENCTLWLRNIPVGTQLWEIFDAVDTGAVFALHINPANDMFRTMAAKLSFMNPEAAAAFLSKVHGPFGIWFRGHQLNGVYNREGDRRSLARVSRVVCIVGPEIIMYRSFWEEFFRPFFIFQLERVIDFPSAMPGCKGMEVRFARVDGQAQACLNAVKDHDHFEGSIEVSYGRDTCAPSISFGFYGPNPFR